MSDFDLAAHVTQVLSHVFTGNATDAVIAILMLVVCCMAVLIWLLIRILCNKEKMYKELLDQYSSTMKENQDKIQQLSESYVHTLKELNDESNENAKEVSVSLTEVRVVVTEVKALLTSLMMRGGN